MKNNYFFRIIATLVFTGVLFIQNVAYSQLPVVTLEQIVVGSTTVISLSQVSSDGGSSITSKGVCWSTSSNPTTADSKTVEGAGIDNYTSIITGLTSSNTYYFRAYATNTNGTSYSNQISFLYTPATDITGNTTTVTDIDGKIYNAKGIGSQMWMIENLKVSKLRNAQDINYVTDGSTWVGATVPVFTWYNNDSTTYNELHGKLYNGYAIESGLLCPTGWHVPTFAEWMTLIQHLGGIYNADTKIKFSGTNSSGFSGRYSGVRNAGGVFEKINQVGNWWASSASLNSNMSGLYIWYGDANCTPLGAGLSKAEGWSVRCIKDCIDPIVNITGSNTICTGASTTLTASGGGTYLWSPGNLTTAQITVSPSVNTTYTVTVNNGGCTASSSVAVTVNSAPTANAGTDQTICQGGTPATLSASGGTSYQWSPATGLSATNVSGPAANPSSTTTYTVTVTDANGCTASDAMVLTVNAYPGPTASSNSPVTVGSALTLTGGPGGMVSYNWAGPDAYTSSSQSPTVSGSATLPMGGNYTLTVTDANGCTGTATTVVTVSAGPPTISSFTPTLGPIGTSVTITGTNFNTTSSNNIVFFGATMATVTSASSSSLTVTVPAGATYNYISVTDITTGLTAYSIMPFNPTFTCGGVIDNNSMAAKVDFTTGTSPIDVSIGDLDGDGKPDMAVTNYGANNVSVYRNISTSGTVSFDTKVDFTSGSNPGSVQMRDLNGDGKPELVVVNGLGTSVSAFKNISTSGNISFDTKADFSTGTYPQNVSIGDIDGDGKPDLVIPNNSGSTVSVLRNLSSSGGAITFATKVNFSVGSSARSGSIGDLDGDGKPDIAVANGGSNTVSVLRNTSTSGTISFAAKVDLATGSNPYSVSISDLDGDGKLDLAVPNQANTFVSVFRNTGSSGTISFATKVDFTTGSGPRSLSIGDLDGDSKPDLAVANETSNTVSILKNTGSSGTVSFAAKVDFASGTGPTVITLGDLDGDSKPDIAVTNYTTTSVAVLRNTVSNPNTITLTSSVGTDAQTVTQNTAITNITYSTTGATGATFSGLPTGVNGIWTANTVSISGTPSVTGTFNYHVIAIGGCANDTTVGTITVTGWSCGSPLSITHTAGLVAPVTKTVSYGTVSSNLSGSSKCWITQNLGSDQQATSATDASEASAGWYWQFNKKQGFKHDGSTRTPSTTWITPIDEYYDWLPSNDPCTSELGAGWRIPTYSEWNAANVNGAWAGYNGAYTSELKIHAAGALNGVSGGLAARGSQGYYWSSTQTASDQTYGVYLLLQNSTASSVASTIKTAANTIRCIKDTCSIPSVPGTITGSSTVCPGATGLAYSISPVAGATSYSWSEPPFAGWAITSGQGSTSITVTSGAVGGALGVKAINSCGSSINTYFPITISTSNTITLTSAVGTDNQTVMQNNAITTISYATTGATGASFSGLPTGVTGNWTSNIVTISGTPSVTGTFNYEIIANGGCGNDTITGTITVTATWSCGSPLSITHTAGAVAPVTKTVSYGTVSTSLSGASKCWITQNLGSDQQATSATDGTELSAGWYWQFNKKQGYKHDGSTLTPSWNATPIDENKDWTEANDPCALELGAGWRLPTNSEWTTADVPWGSSSDIYNSVLKMHAAGYLDKNSNGALTDRGTNAKYWSSTQTISTQAYFLDFGATWSYTINEYKPFAFPVRCIKDICPAPATPGTITGPEVVCTTDLNRVYSISAVSGASSYSWQFPAGWFVVSGQSTTSVTVNPTLSGQSGNISVKAVGTCGTSPASYLAATVNVSNSATLTSAVGTDAQTICESVTITNISYSTTGATGATFNGLPSGVSGIWTANTISISGTPSETGTFNYSINLEGGCGNVSKTGTITVMQGGVAAVNITAVSNPVCNGVAASFTATPVNGGGTPSYQWKVNGVNVGTNSTTYSAVVNHGDMVSCVMTSASPCVTGNPATSNSINMIVNADNSIVLSSSMGTDAQTACINTAITNITYTTVGATGATVTGLPAGVSGSFGSNTVTISGTPTATGTYNYTVNLSGGCGTVTATGSIIVNPLNTITLSSNVGSDAQAVLINTTINNIAYITTGATGASFSGLPSGVSGLWTANTIAISGTPDVSGTFNYTITLTGGCGTVTKTGVITVTGANTITLTSGVGTDNQTTCMGTSITTIKYGTVGATGATFSGLPAGVTGAWAANEVTISGTTTATGTYSYTVTLTGGSGTGSATGTIVVNPDNVITITVGSNTQTVCINTSISSVGYFTSGATGATFSGLPPGVTGSWLSNNVTISGTPTEFGTFNYTVSLTGGCGTVSTAGTITVNPENTAVLTSAVGTDAQTACTTTAITNIYYSTTGATGATVTGLPSGVNGSWATNTVTISGTPSAQGTYNYTVTLNGGCGTVTKTGTITVAINAPTTPGAITGYATQCPGATGQIYSVNTVPDASSYEWTVPTGWTITAGATTNSITVTAGAYGQDGNITVKAQNPCGYSGVSTLAVTVSSGVPPTPGAITGTTVQCPGTTSQIYSISTVPGALSYSWQVPSGWSITSGTGTNSITVTIGTTSGNINVKANNDCGSSNQSTLSVAVSGNTITLTSANGTDAQTICPNTAITNITYSTTGATGANITGLPSGVTGNWTSNFVNISGTPTTSGTYNYNIELTGGCGNVTKNGTILVKADALTPPVEGAHVPGITQIQWKWNPLAGATGYKYNTVNDYGTATNVGTNTSYTQTGLTCGGISYTLYVWAYDACAHSIFPAELTQITDMCVAPNCGTVTDADNNVYSTVIIGTQCWMKENLKSTKYKNGTAIAYPGTNNTAWTNNTGGAYAWYNNDASTYASTYGALYNWYAVNNGNGLCPAGWLVPTDDDWTTMTTYLGGESVAGGKLKETGTTHWNTPNTGATNEAYFKAVPGGDRSTIGLSENLGNNALFWTATINGANAWGRSINYNVTNVIRNDYVKNIGLSIRCIKDNCNTTPTIDVQPANSSVCELGNTTFSTSATGTSLTYKWEVSTDGGTNWSGLVNGGVYSNVTSPTMNITGAIAAMNGYKYRCYVVGTCLPTTTNAATLTIMGAPDIILQPTTTNACNNGTGTFTVNALGAGLTYAWEESTDGGSSWTALTNTSPYSGVTTDVLTISPVTSSMNNYKYRVIITGTCTPVETSFAADLIVGGVNTVTLTSSVGTDNQSGCINSPITPITYSFTGATGATFSGLPTGVSGTSNTTTISITGIPQVAGQYNYTVTLTGGCGTVTAQGTITISNLPNTPLTSNASNITASGFTANWSPVPNSPSGYYLDIAYTSSFTNIINTFTIVGNVTTYDVSGLNCGTMYYYRVRSYKNTCVSGNSTGVGVFTSSCVCPSIGDSYQGGKVAYLLQAGDPGYVVGGCSGLIAATSDQGTTQWGCEGTSITTATAFGTGQDNTSAIVAGCNASVMAAKICNDLVSNGYDDWYLPSQDELNKLYINRALIGGFTSGSYWSSSEQDAYSAWQQNFSSGAVNSDSKSNANAVRAVRLFLPLPPAPPPLFVLDTVCIGDSVAYKIPPVQGATEYEWSFSGTYDTLIGSGTSVTLVPLTDGTLSVTAKNNCGTSDTTQLDIKVFNYGSLEWIGVQDNNWFNAKNWNPVSSHKNSLGCQIHIPGPSTEVTISPTADYQPIIDIDSMGTELAHCNSIFIDENDTLTFINDAQATINSLYIYGDLKIYGTVILENDSNVIRLKCDTGEIEFAEINPNKALNGGSFCRTCNVVLETGANYTITKSAAEAKTMTVEGTGALSVADDKSLTVYKLDILTSDGSFTLGSNSTLNVSGEVKNDNAGTLSLTNGTVYYNNGGVDDYWLADSGYKSQTVLPLTYGILKANGGNADESKELTLGSGGTQFSCNTLELINMSYPTKVTTASDIHMTGGATFNYATDIASEGMEMDLNHQISDITTFNMGDINSSVINVIYVGAKAMTKTSGDFTFYGTVNYKGVDGNQTLINSNYRNLGLETHPAILVQVNDDALVNNELSLRYGGLKLNSKTVTIDNQNPTAITYTHGYVNTEDVAGGAELGSMDNIVKWNIKASPGGVYTVPFGVNQKLIPFKYQVAVNNMDPVDGYVKFSTYGTVSTNLPRPPGVTHLGYYNDGGLTVNRYWYFDYPSTDKSHADAPLEGFLTFTYLGSELDGVGESNIMMAQRYNPQPDSSFGVWADVLYTQNTQTVMPVYGGSVCNPISSGEDTGSFKTSYIDDAQFFKVWVLVSQSVPLPIELVKFEAKCISGVIDIKWATATETNNNFFTVEKSSDGVSWQILQIVPTAGNGSTQNNYHVIDTNPFDGVSYYRLKQTDNNGKDEYYTAVVVNCMSNNAANAVFYPNLFTNSINIAFSNITASEALVQVFDVVGKLVKTKNFINIQDGQGSVTLDMSDVSSGVYFVKFIAGDFVQLEKVVKQK